MFLDWLQRSLPRQAKTTRGRFPPVRRWQCHRYQPRLEALEDRNLLSTLTLGNPVNTGHFSGNQTEPTIAINPTNPKILVVFSNDDGSPTKTFDLFTSYTLDGGKTWHKSIISKDTPGIGRENAPAYDAQATFDNFGNLFVTYLTANNNVVVARSKDNGATFQAIFNTGTGLVERNDQPSIATGPGIPGDGGSVWISYRDSTGQIVARGAEEDKKGGLEFQEDIFKARFVLPGSAAVRGNFGDIAIGPNGQVMVSYQSGTGAAGGAGPSNIYVNVNATGLKTGSRFGPQMLVTDTGVGQSRIIAEQNNSLGIDAKANLAWAYGEHAAHKGRVYLVYTDVNTNGKMYILSRFKDPSKDWSSPVIVNQCPHSLDGSRFNPSIAVDQTTGNVAVAWYDARLATANNANLVTLFVAVSDNGGARFSDNTPVSGKSDSTKSTPLLGRALGFGDYAKDASFSGGVCYPVWADNSNSDLTNPPEKLGGKLYRQMDIYTAQIVVNPGKRARADDGAAPALTDSGSSSDNTAVEWGGSNWAAAFASLSQPKAVAPAVRFSDANLAGFLGSMTTEEAVALTGGAGRFHNGDVTQTPGPDGNNSSGRLAALTDIHFDALVVPTFGEVGS
jgi:hypothetical protein